MFAVGVITFELLTGKSIYAADDVGQLFGAILEGRTRKLRELAPSLPEALEEVIVRATALEPSVRHQTAGAFAESYAHAIGVPSMRSQLATPTRCSIPRPRPRSTSKGEARRWSIPTRRPSRRSARRAFPSMEPPAPRHLESRPALANRPVSRGPIVVIAPMRTVSEWPDAAKPAMLPLR